MSGLTDFLLGPKVTRYPYDCIVTYQDGAEDVMHFWAENTREALSLLLAWMPNRETPATRIVFTKREQQ